MNKILYVVLHTHSYGVTTYLFYSDRADIGGFVCNEDEISPVIQDIINLLDLDFEPRKGESLDINNVYDGRADIKELWK